MSNHRNWRQIPKDELQQIVTAHDTGCENCARLAARIAELETVLKQVRKNMEARSAVGFDFEAGEYPVTGETITMLCLDNNDLRAALAAVKAERDALRGYVQHKPNCEGTPDSDADKWTNCTCGLSELLEGKE